MEERDVLIGIAVDGNKNSKSIVNWAIWKFKEDSPKAFKLLHVRPKTIKVPTEMGTHIPLSNVREDVAVAYRMEMRWQAQQMLVPYQRMIADAKLPVDIALLESDDVPAALAEKVEEDNIAKLIIGASRSGLKLGHWSNRLPARISATAPGFCTVYAIWKGKLSFLRPPQASEGTISRSGSSSARSTPVTSSPASSDPAPFRYRQTFSFNSNAYSESKEETDPVAMRVELERLRTELRHAQGIYAMARGEEINLARMVDDLSNRRAEETERLEEMRRREEEAEKLVRREKERREEAVREVKSLKEMAVKEEKQRREAEMVTEWSAQEREKLKRGFIGNSTYQSFTWEDVVYATSSFSESLKIGKGVYRCPLLHTQAAVRILDDGTNAAEFRKEVELLSAIRHPHLLIVLGAFPERGCVVYEYMNNGSLDDRLRRISNSNPIPWRARFRIAWEIGAALVFLHNSKPRPVIHGNLNPENIFLDHNLLSKIGNAGIARNSSSSSSIYYADPEDQRTGITTPQSDVYAFGNVILQLLTARSAKQLAYIVEIAIEEDRLGEILDNEGGGMAGKGGEGAGDGWI